MGKNNHKKIENVPSVITETTIVPEDIISEVPEFIPDIIKVDDAPVLVEISIEPESDSQYLRKWLDKHGKTVFQLESYVNMGSAYYFNKILDGRETIKPELRFALRKLDTLWEGIHK